MLRKRAFDSGTFSYLKIVQTLVHIDTARHIVIDTTVPNFSEPTEIYRRWRKKINRLYAILLICALSIGCAALTTEQTYVRIDAPVTEKFIASGIVYSIPEPKEIRTS